MKLYGSLLCHDCPPTIDFLKKKGVIFEFVNITDDILNLKEFILLRDSDAKFKPIIENSYIGIPALVCDDGKILIDEEIYAAYGSVKP